MPYKNYDNLGIETLEGWHGVHKQHALTFPSDSNQYEIPDLAPYNGPIPSTLIGYDSLGRAGVDKTGACVHCYCQDEKMNAVWSRPGHALKRVQEVGYAITPDFSVYEDFPLAIKLYNKYRSNWVGAFWQREGVQVIPNVTWAGKDSYKIMFAGIPRQSIVSVGSVGAVRSRQERLNFCFHYEVMIELLMPTDVIFFGNVPKELPREGYELHTFPTRWQEYHMKGKVN